VKFAARVVQNPLKAHPNVRNVIAVASGKGGVGKSTVAVNVAMALQQQQYRVGLLDADIYGPSQPTMLGAVHAHPASEDGKKIQPVDRYGLQTMSIGYLVDTDSALIWRGPKVSGALQQLFQDTAWDNLDFLVVDLPPGTGDVQLTMAQKIPITGMLIVTTPQDVALVDVQRAVAMAKKVGIHLLGVVENMAALVCESCGHETHVFGSRNSESAVKDLGLECLVKLPLDPRICTQGDKGEPMMTALPQSEPAKMFSILGEKVVECMESLEKDYSALFGDIVVQPKLEDDQ